MSGDFLPDVYLKQSHSFAVIRIRIKSKNIDKGQIHIHIVKESSLLKVIYSEKATKFCKFSPYF